MDLIDIFAQFPQKTNKIVSKTQNQILYQRFKIKFNKNNEDSVLALRLPNYIYNTYNIPYCIWHVPGLEPTESNQQRNKKRQKNRKQILQRQLAATRQKYGIDIQISNSLDDTLFQVDVLLQTDSFDKVYIFCFPSQLEELKCIYQDAKKVEKIICYQTDDNEEIVMFEGFKVKYQDKDNNKIVMASNLKNCFNEYISTPNFFLFRNQFEQQNLVKMSLYAMLKQTNIQCRKMLIRQIQPVIYKICPEAENQYVDSFLNLYQQSDYKRLPTQKILSQYSSQTFFHVFVNRFLRGIVDPIELYYLQPIFQDLYLAIHDLYQQQRQNSLPNQPNNKQFVCYRRTSFKQNQILLLQNSVGSCIEALGFISTSLSKAKAMQFFGNSLLVIKVNDTQRQCQNDHGFAFIKEYSQFQGEQEVLFNPLNSYTVDSVKKGNPNIIQLTYGKISELFKIKKQGNKKELSIDEQIMYILALEQQQKLQRIKNQGSVLLLSGRYMEGSVQFWGKKYEISSRKKADNSKNLAQAYKIFGHHDKAVELLLESKNIQKETNETLQYADTIDKLLQFKFVSQNKPFLQINEMRNEVLMIRQQKYQENNGLLNWADSLRSSAVFLYHFKCFQDAIKDLNLGIQLIQQACMDLYEKGKLATRSANLLVTRALCYKKLKKIQNAKQDLQQASRIIKTLYGQHNPFYALINQQIVLLHQDNQKQLEYIKKANVKPEKKKGFEYKICQPFSEMLQKLQQKMYLYKQINVEITQKQMKTLILLHKKMQQVNKRVKKQVEPSPHLNNQQNIAQNGFQAIMQMMKNITEASRKEGQYYRKQLQKLEQK